MLKSELRKKVLKVRKKFNTKNIQLNFKQIIKILKKEKVTNQITIGGYYPVNFEIDDLTLLRKFKNNKFNEKIYEAAYKINAKLEKQVVEGADHIVTATPVYIPFFATKSDNIDESKFTSIPNGYDPRDFENFDYGKNKKFTITYTGTISEQYNINPFLDALARLRDTNLTPFTLQFVGSVYPILHEELAKRNLDKHTVFSNYVPHKESIKFLEKASLLLVCGPLNKDKKEGGIPAKVYEYLAARKPIIYIGKKDGFVAEVLKETGSGESFDTDSNAIYNYLLTTCNNWTNEIACLPPNEAIQKYSRPLQAETFLRLLK